MKIFLIEAPYNYGAMKVAIKRHFPLGLAYIAAYLKKNLNNAVIELFLEDVNANFYLLLRNRVAKFAPDLIGISSMTPSFYSAYEICKFIKQEFDIPIVIGGQHASALRAEILTDDAPFDFIVYGEGENTALELCEKLDKRQTDFENIKGLIFRKDGRIITAQSRPLISDVDTIPHPARELADLTNFGAHSYINFGRNVATLISSRGCAFLCLFV